jgi:hypothetical protein
MIGTVDLFWENLLYPSPLEHINWSPLLQVLVGNSFGIGLRFILLLAAFFLDGEFSLFFGLALTFVPFSSFSHYL